MSNNTIQILPVTPAIPQNVLELMTALSHTNQVFLREYLTQTTRNARQAYLLARPHVTVGSADSCANEVLNRPKVKEVVDLYDRECNAVSIARGLANRVNLVEKAYKVYEKAEKSDQLGVALQGIDLTAKLNRLYEKDREDPGDWQKLTQNIFVQNNTIITNATPQVGGEEGETIDCPQGKNNPIESTG